MKRRMELLALPVPKIIPATKAMADAQEHVLVAQLEEVSAGHIFVDRDARNAIGQEIADIFPLAAESGRFRDGWVFPAEDGVVGIGFQPAERIPLTVFVVEHIARFGLGRDGI